MDRLAKVVERRCAEGRVGEVVRVVERASAELTRVFKQEFLQAVIDRSVEKELGARQGGFGGAKRSPWSCPGCGPRLGAELRHNGHYLRRPLVCEGSITLRIPQLVCRTCAKAVPFSHPLLPRRKRLWLDIDQQVAMLYLEGCSYRAVRRLLERRCGSSIGLMTVWRSFMATGAGKHDVPGRPPARYLGLDEVYHRVGGPAGSSAHAPRMPPVLSTG